VRWMKASNSFWGSSQIASDCESARRVAVIAYSAFRSEGAMGCSPHSSAPCFPSSPYV
jgi:hypothetical protein